MVQVFSLQKSCCQDLVEIIFLKKAWRFDNEVCGPQTGGTQTEGSQTGVSSDREVPRLKGVPRPGEGGPQTGGFQAEGFYR